MQANYYGNVNETLLNLLATEDTRILEFGCGSGGFASAARKLLGDDVYYVGIDCVATAVEQARSALDHGLERNIDRVIHWESDVELNTAAPLGTFDVVVLGDVLEHLVEPDQCLRHASKLIRPGGRVLACIPNVQHWSVFVQLVLGSWPRLDAGIFDKTHLRWFALNDMVSLFQGAGLTVTAIVPRIFDPATGRDIMEYLEPLARHLGADPEQVIAKGLPLQYVLQGVLPACAGDQ